MAKIIVGIDFGTSTTVVRWRKEDSDEIHVIKDSNGHTVIDSAIFKPEDSDEWIFGRQATRQENRKGELVRNFKMDLISSDPDENSGAEVHVRRFMEYVYHLFVKDTVGVSYDSMDVYISYPVKWSTEKKTLMKRIISDAGFGACSGSVITGQTEPEAAAIELMRIHMSHLVSTGTIKVNVPLNVMMLDMGAGTSDLFLFQIMLKPNGEIIIPEDKVTQYPVSEQPYNCGGREIDKTISNEILDYLSRGMKRPTNERWFSAKMAKDWKDQVLSDTLKMKVNGTCRAADAPSSIIPIIEQSEDLGLWDKTVGEYRMSRSKFEAMTENHWDNLYRLIRNGMAKFKHDCHIGAEDIDFVFLTGGHSQWYCVPNLFNGEGINGTIAVNSEESDSLTFTKIINDPWRILQGMNPQETVANGLCWPDWVHIPNKAKNNVWVRFSANELRTEYKQIINIGDSLPQIRYVGQKLSGEQSQEGCDPKEYTIWIDRHAVFSKQDDNLLIEILEGETIDNATRSVFQYHYPGFGILGNTILAVLFLGIPFFLKERKAFSYNAHLGLNKDGTVYINGCFAIDGKKMIDFKDTDFNK